MKNLFSRSTAIRALCLLLALCLSCAAFPLTAFADSTSVTRSGTYHYMSNDGKTIQDIYTEDTFLYNDSWFLTDGRVFNRHLATLSAIASITSAGYYDANVSDFSQHDKNAKEFLDEMQFEDIESNTYYHLEGFQNSASCIIGHKTIGTGSDAQTLLVVLPMSAGYGQEWYGNFTVDEAGLHAGFKAARDECLRFCRQYVTKHQITGDIKLWTAGHSRGSAIANLIGSYFALDGGNFFDGCGFTVSPENIYAYTFATPGTVTEHGVTAADVLSVAGSRTDYPNDTPGDEYVYAGADAESEVNPASEQFSCVHNCRPSYDIITLLPPDSWNFTVFGSTFAITDGEASTKALMVEWMKKADIDVYNAYQDENMLAELINTGSHGDADEYAWKKLDLSTFTIKNDGELSMSDMMAQRTNSLTLLAEDRASYAENYQEVFQAVFGVYGLAEKELFANLDIMNELKPLLVNYLAYASERMGNDDTAATLEMLCGLYQYLSGEEIDAQNITVREFVSKYAALIQDNIILELLVANIIPQETRAKICEVLDIKEYAFSSYFDALLGQLHSADEAENAEGFHTLCRIVAKLLEDKGDLTPLFTAAGISPEGANIGEGKLSDAVAALLDVVLKDDEGRRMTIAQKADALLVDLAAKVGNATVAAIREKGYSEHILTDLTSYFTTIGNNPAKVRRILFHIVSCTDSDQPFDFAKELRTLITFLSQSNKIRYAHYNELHIAWMRAQDSVYNGDFLGDADEDKTVTILDATTIQRHLARLHNLSKKGTDLADADRNQRVEVLDAVIIQRYIAGIANPKGVKGLGEPV